MKNVNWFLFAADFVLFLFIWWMVASVFQGPSWAGWLGGLIFAILFRIAATLGSLR